MTDWLNNSKFFNSSIRSTPPWRYPKNRYPPVAVADDAVVFFAECATFSRISEYVQLFLRISDVCISLLTSEKFREFEFLTIPENLRESAGRLDMLSHQKRKFQEERMANFSLSFSRLLSF